MATIVVNKYTEEPITRLSRYSSVAGCPKCGAGIGGTLARYLSETAAHDVYGVGHDALRVDCMACGYQICLMPCADAKEKADD